MSSTTERPAERQIERAAPKKQPIHRCPKNAISIEYEGQSGHGRGTWYARIPSGHTREDVLRPEYFGLMQSENATGKVLRACDVIEIEPEDARWMLRARVMGLRFATQQVLLREVSYIDFSVKEPPGFRFVWQGEQAAWAIFKGETMVDSGLSTEDECLARVEELKRERAA